MCGKSIYRMSEVITGEEMAITTPDNIRVGITSFFTASA
jgi:hypothetical protein